jgi:tetratricopeptide (TPR) repeat protein
MTDEQQPLASEDQPYEELASEDNDEVQQQVRYSILQEPVAEPESSKQGFSLMALWENVRRAFFPTYYERTEQLNRRITRLTRAIEFSPETPTNYVLRGELYLELGNYVAAAADFRDALELTTTQVAQEDWGVVAQVMQDRAQNGLAEAERSTL